MEDIDMESIGHGGTRSRCCFCFPSSWSRMRTFQNDDRWWSRGIRALYKLREWSEIVAGPRWKTFIRRFNRSRSIGRGAGSSNHGKFQYDPLSYALNFDEGPVDEDDEVVGFRNFSVRYASFPQPAKSGGCRNRVKTWRCRGEEMAPRRLSCAGGCFVKIYDLAGMASQ